MINSILEMNNLNEIADAVIGKIGETTDPFITPVVVFHNARVQQWFKSYFLKHYNSVLMNVEYKTLSSYINEVLISNKKIRILNRTDLRAYLIKVLSEIDYESVDVPRLKYIFTNGKLDGIKLYDFANKLSTILINMEYDNEECVEWENNIYKKALEYAAKDNCYSPKDVLVNFFQNEHKDNPVFIIDNSYISELYKKVLEKQDCNITIFTLSEKVISESNALKIYSAPSILREVEILHTDILKKLQKNKDIRTNDFVVYAPSINDYATAIRRVFNQNGQEYPNVPFVISGENKEKRDIVNLLYLLYEIANKGFFTRKDLSKYLNNSMIMKIRELTDEDIDSFTNVVIKTNTFRNSDKCNEWDYLKKRLLSSLLVECSADLENVVSFKDGDYLPFNSNSLDKSLINKLIDIIDALLSWSSLFTGDLRELIFYDEDLVRVENVLDLLFSFKDEDGKEENYLYFDVKKEIERVRKTTPQILAITLLRLLLDAPTHSSVSPANVFSGGVTFLNLDCDNIVPAEYIYVLGMSSDNFPRIETKNELDFSENHIMTQVLDRIAINNILSMPTEKYISFVNCDLKTGEEFFISSLIPNAEIIKVSIDENRDYSELFTRREMINKAYFEGIGSEGIEKESIEVQKETEFVIKSSELKQYLENAFIYKYKKILKDTKEDDEFTDNEYETIDIAGLSEYAIIKELILNKDDIKKFLLQKKLPYQTEEAYFNYFCESASIIREIIDNGYAEIEKGKTVFKIGEKTVILEVNSNVYVKFDNNELYLIEPKKYKTSEKLKLKDYLPLYVCSLIFAASHNSDDKITIHLLPIPDCEKTFEINKHEAEDLLKNILDAMTDFENIKYMDIDYIEESVKNTNKKSSKPKDVIPTSIEKLKDTLADKKHGHYSMKYFNDSIMFDENYDYGYTDKIHTEMTEEFKKIKSFIVFLNVEGEDE